MVNIEEQSDFISGNKSSKEIIDCHSRENAIFSGAISAIPGPAGILTMIPELIFVVKTKVKMINALGRFYGQESFFNKEILIGMLLLGKGMKTSLFDVEGSEVRIKKGSPDIFKSQIMEFTNGISKEMLEKSFVKMMPVASSISMLAWARKATQKTGAVAVNIFQKKLKRVEQLAS